MARLPGQTLPDQMRAFRAKAIARLDTMTRATVEELARKVIARTPVDTGLLVSNWNYGLSSPNISTSEVPGEKALNYFAEMPPKAAGLKHYVTNSVHYARFVERGTSRMAPRAMVALTVVEFDDVARHALTIAKQAHP